MEQRLKAKDLLRLLVILDQRLIDENTHPEDCEKEWTATLVAAGYTPQEYEKLISKSVDHIGSSAFDVTRSTTFN